MIDIHCHVLPQIDDGPQNIEESIRMCQIAHEDGIRIIVSTTHYISKSEKFKNGGLAVLEKL